ncbi:MAG: cache domain-containing protein, partial [Candidatus Rokuibacteriota bacterium]
MASQSPQLRRSFLVTGAIVATTLVAALGIATGRASDHILKRQARDRALTLGRRAVTLVSQYLEDRRLEAERLATVPDIARAAEAGSAEAVARGLDQRSAADLERAFAATHALGADAALTTFIRDYVGKSDFAEVFFTERHGLIVAASGPTSDFVQTDETWWREAMTVGVYEGEPGYDSSAALVTMEYDVAIRARGQGRPVGVLKAAFDLGKLSELLA